MNKHIYSNKLKNWFFPAPASSHLQPSASGMCLHMPCFDAGCTCCKSEAPALAKTNSSTCLSIVKFIAFVLAAIVVARFCHYQTDGFKVCKIRDNYILGETPKAPTAQILDILDQKFTYFGRGLQSFAFVSQDGKYVLKLFNNKYQKKIFHKELYNQKLQKTFNSYKMAFNLMQEECGLLYMHLSPSYLFSKPALIIDKLNIFHSIDLNNTAFLIQKRANPVYPTLAKLIEENKTEDAKQALFSLLCLIDRKLQMVDDNDPLIRTNMGFIDGKAMQIDVGPFSVKTKTDTAAEFKHITTSLRNWLQEHAPYLITYIDEYEKTL